MTWFSLPVLRPDRAPLFVDADGCNAWLAGQPLANAPQMQIELANQLDSLNSWSIPPRDRFKILEALRKAVMAVETESIKRYEFRPLPLAPVEQKALDNSCRLWRTLATGYLHCLRACLDGDPAIVEHGAKVSHRILSTLRLEQISRYRGGAAIPDAWWRLLHATLASAEQLGASTDPVTDRLFAETRESTPAGQFVMAVLLHLCRPYELSRSQLSAAQRWLARWRELAAIHSTAAAVRDSRHLLVDLSSDQPVHVGNSTPGMARWIALDGVLGKFKSRLKALREGQSPEELKLGSSMPPEACIGLLQFLHGALQTPSGVLPEDRREAPTVAINSTIDGIHRLLGGKPVSNPSAPTAQSNRRAHEQIAIFGRVVRDDDGADAAVATEAWRLVSNTPGELTLVRAAGSPGERLANRALIAVRMSEQGNPSLAIVRCLVTLETGALLAIARLLPGEGQPRVAVGREKMSNKVLHEPAVFLPATASLNNQDSVFIASGLMSRLTRLDIADLPGGLKVGTAIERGSNYERLRCE